MHDDSAQGRPEDTETVVDLDLAPQQAPPVDKEPGWLHASEEDAGAADAGVPEVPAPAPRPQPTPAPAVHPQRTGRSSRPGGRSGATTQRPSTSASPVGENSSPAAAIPMSEAVSAELRALQAERAYNATLLREIQAQYAANATLLRELQTETRASFHQNQEMNASLAAHRREMTDISAQTMKALHEAMAENDRVLTAHRVAEETAAAKQRELERKAEEAADQRRQARVAEEKAYAAEKMKQMKALSEMIDKFVGDVKDAASTITSHLNLVNSSMHALYRKFAGLDRYLKPTGTAVAMFVAALIVLQLLAPNFSLSDEEVVDIGIGRDTRNTLSKAGPTERAQIEKLLRLRTTVQPAPAPAAK